MLQDDGSWRLQFTDKDELYVTGYEVDGQSSLYLAGYMSIVPESLDESDPTHANFAGELKVYEQVDVFMGFEEIWVDDEDGGHYEEDTSSPIYETQYDEIEYDLGVYDSPLKACSGGLNITLIPSGNRSVFLDDGPWISLDYSAAIADSVSDLMKNGVWVSGSYDSDLEMFILDYGGPILDVTISGLTAGVGYKMTLYYTNKSEYLDDSGMWSTMILPESPLSAASDGTLHFAANVYNGWNYEEETDPVYYFIKLEECFNKTYTVLLGAKFFDEENPKVYKVERAASADYVDPTLPTVTGDFYYYDRYFSIEEGHSCTVSGTGSDVQFYVNTGGTLCLENATLTRDDECDVIWGDDDFTLNLQGNSSISSKTTYTIYGTSGIVVIGNGTLEITSTYDNVSDYFMDYGLNAGTGYTLEHSELSDNEDGTYTFTITVKPE